MTTHTAYRDTLDSGMERIVLTSPGCMVQLAPNAGLNLYSWIIGGRELMMPTQDTGAGGDQYGNPLLFPTPNRVRDCKYTFGGQTHTMQKNGEERFIHGLVLDEPFDCEIWQDDEGAYCRGRVSIREGEDMHRGYPFPCTFTAEIALRGREIEFTFTVENEGKGEMPFGVAIHPYFTKAGDPEMVYLSCPVTKRYEVCDKLLPTGTLLDAVGDPVYDLNELRRLSDTDVDMVYINPHDGRRARIEYRHWDLAVELESDEVFSRVVVYTPQNRPGFCIEPQTCATDFINLYSRGLRDESGILILPPGEKWRGRTKMTAGKL